MIITGYPSIETVLWNTGEVAARFLLQFSLHVLARCAGAQAGQRPDFACNLGDDLSGFALGVVCDVKHHVGAAARPQNIGGAVEDHPVEVAAIGRAEALDGNSVFPPVRLLFNVNAEAGEAHQHREDRGPRQREIGFDRQEHAARLPRACPGALH